MKKLFTNFLGLALSVMVLASCSQMATYEQEDLTLDEVAAAKNGFNLTPYGTPGNENASLTTCGTCVAEPVHENFTTSLNNNSNYADVEVWNDMDKLYIKVSANGSNTMDEIKLSYPFSYVVNGDPKNCNYAIQYNNTFNKDIDNGGLAFTTHTFEFPLGTFETDWNKCDLESFALRVAGISGTPVFLQGTDGQEVVNYTQGQSSLQKTCFNVPTSVGYALHEICSGCDSESFSYNATNNNLSVIFKYDAATVLTNAVVEFTFPQILAMTLDSNGKYVAPDEKIYTVNNATNQTVFTWTGNIGCTDATATTFQFNFSPDCGAQPANDGEAVIWTDTKVNGISVNNVSHPEYTNIKYTGCN